MEWPAPALHANQIETRKALLVRWCSSAHVCVCVLLALCVTGPGMSVSFQLPVQSVAPIASHPSTLHIPALLCAQ